MGHSKSIPTKKIFSQNFRFLVIFAIFGPNEWDAKRNSPGLPSELGHLWYSNNQWNARGKIRYFLSELGRQSILEKSENYWKCLQQKFGAWSPQKFLSEDISIINKSSIVGRCQGTGGIHNFPLFEKMAMSLKKIFNGKKFLKSIFSF